MLPVAIKRYGECDYAFMEKTQEPKRKLESFYKLCRRGVSYTRRLFQLPAGVIMLATDIFLRKVYFKHGIV